jgi:hypothetical protein
LTKRIEKEKVEMDSFDNLESLHEFFDSDSTCYEYPHQIGEKFKIMREKFRAENKSENAQRAQWEVDFFHFRPKDGKLVPSMTYTNQDGQLVELPSLANFDESTYQYLIERFRSTKNPFLKAQYSLILWNSPNRHGDYAKAAIESLLMIVDINQREDEDHPTGHYGLHILDAIKNAFYIARESNSDISTIKAKITSLLQVFNPESSSSFCLRYGLAELMLEEKRVFEKNYFEGIQEKLWELSDKLSGAGEFYQTIQICELGDKVEKRMGTSKYAWREKIASSNEQLLNLAGEKGGLPALLFCEKAIENYKMIGADKKVDELSRKYAELKGNIKYAKFSQEIDLSDHIKECREIGEKLATKETHEIIRTLMLDKGILPSYKDTAKRAEDIKKESVIKNLIPEVIIDQRGNPVQHFIDDEEKNDLRLFEQYRIYLEALNIHLIRELFLGPIRAEKLGTAELIAFFRENSWFGKNLRRKEGESEKDYNWLNQIGPALNEYFNKVHGLLIFSRVPDFVLSIDCLTLKIEGLIRDMCTFSEIPTFVMKKDKKGRDVIQEKDLNALLHEKKVKSLFNEDDLLFFRFLFVEKAGYNLRHKVAHCLMDYKEYNIDIMHLLILALLKIGRYDFEREEESKNPPEKEKIPN